MIAVGRMIDAVFSRHRWVLQVVFWLFVLLWYGVYFGRQNSNYLQTLFFVGMLLPVTIGASRFLNYYLVPVFLLRERYGFFALYFLYTVIGVLFLELIIVFVTFAIIAEWNVTQMSPASIDVFFLLGSLLTVIFLGLAVKLLLHWRKSQDEYHELLLTKAQEELKLLRSQLNPHFLFNTLNNLYYLTTQRSEKAPEAILQLSEMLDYVLYSGKADFVPLEEEWKQVQNYIGLKLLHYEERLNVDSRVTGDIQRCTVAPMMLLTLIENAFKHSVMKEAGTAWIRVVMHCAKDKLEISVTNSCRNKKGGGGIGLQNLRRQLNILYRDKHVLRINEDLKDQYQVELSLLHAE
jgi:LytS/YehU family sensor histidine kinase